MIWGGPRRQSDEQYLSLYQPKSLYSSGINGGAGSARSGDRLPAEWLLSERDCRRIGPHLWGRKARIDHRDGSRAKRELPLSRSFCKEGEG